jgi:hypothetical protein
MDNHFPAFVLLVIPQRSGGICFLFLFVILERSEESPHLPLPLFPDPAHPKPIRLPNPLTPRLQ